MCIQLEKFIALIAFVNQQSLSFFEKNIGIFAVMLDVAEFFARVTSLPG